MVAQRPAADRRADLVTLYRELSDDHACPLAPTRTNIVFGAGHADAELMFVGEAPGAEEDRQGKPFVGRAGKLLDQLLAEIGLDRTQVFIANTLKCRPPGNRDPQPEEIEECAPHLMRQIELIEPLVICTLGNFATRLLTGSRAGITRVRGRPQRRRVGTLEVVLYPLCHPAAALRGEGVLAGLREDFARLPALVEEARAGGSAGLCGAGDAPAVPELGPDLPTAPGDPGPGPPAAVAVGAGGAATDAQLGLFG